jgi:hypothetical protein
MSDESRGYIPREYKVPTMGEALLELGIPAKEKRFSGKSIRLINRRAFLWLNRATAYAYATLNAAINFYSKEDRGYVEPVLQELSEALNDIVDKETKKSNQEKFETAANAVAHAGNWFNNTSDLLPAEMRKAALEARDICDEAVKQPNFMR